MEDLPAKVKEEDVVEEDEDEGRSKSQEEGREQEYIDPYSPRVREKTGLHRQVNRSSKDMTPQDRGNSYSTRNDTRCPPGYFHCCEDLPSRSHQTKEDAQFQ